MPRGDKTKIIAQIYDRKDSDLLKLFIALMEVYIDENREKIDTARVDEIPNIQGRIVQLKDLINVFHKHPLLKR